jgi:hypothetical protein
LPLSLPQDDAASAERPPAAALAPTVTASPEPASPVPGQLPARPVSARPSPAALVTAGTPVASGATPTSSTPQGEGGQPQRPGRHRRALLFGGGGAAVVLAVLMIALALSHSARPQEIRRMAASGPIAPAVAIPAGYHWLTEPASAAPRRAGFAMAVPDGWQSRQRGETTLVRNPATGASITVTREAPGGAGPLRRAQLLAEGPHRAFPGYHRIALVPVPFHGTLAGAWRFAYVRPGTGNEQVLELVARLSTPLGAQSYELAVTSPRRAWPASRAAFARAMIAFTPQS